MAEAAGAGRRHRSRCIEDLPCGPELMEKKPAGAHGKHDHVQSDKAPDEQCTAAPAVLLLTTVVAWRQQALHIETFFHARPAATILKRQ